MTAGAAAVLASDEWTKEHGTGISFHAGVTFWRAVGLSANAVQYWIVGMPPVPPEVSELDVWIAQADTTKNDMAKLLDSSWCSISQILPEEKMTTIEPLLQALLLMCSSAQDALCF